jgi:tetratricopeptide (TPR) repeat protein
MTTITTIQLIGLRPTVLLNSPNIVSPSFTAPRVTLDTKLIFELTAKDNKGNKGSTGLPATVSITVKATPFIPSRNLTDPNEINTLNNIGLVLRHQGNYTGAIEYYDKALAINPKDSCIE